MPAMTNQEHILAFRNSLTGVIDVLNFLREHRNLPPVQANRMLNFNAYDRAVHFLRAGLDDTAEYEETVRPFKGQDISDAVELVRQWPLVKEPEDYLLPFTKEEPGRSILMGDYAYMGIAGEMEEVEGKEWPHIRAVVVIVLTNNQPGWQG